MIKRALIALFVFQTVYACGLNTHLHLAQRTFTLLQQTTSKKSDIVDIIAHNMESLEAGAFFPDWGYSCAGNHEESEMSHWPKFFMQAAKYYNAKYSNDSNSAEAQEFVAFLLGAISHSVADIGWHSLDRATGLITAAAMSDFDNDFQKAHGAADEGGMFILEHVLRRTSYEVVAPHFC